MRAKTEILVGAVFLIGLVIFGLITFKVSDLGALLQEDQLRTARFNHIATLAEGDGVHVAGLRVGEIKSLSLNGSYVLVTMELDAGVTLRTSSVARIAWGGVIGSRYIDISLGDPADPVLPAGQDILTEEAIEIEQVLRKLDGAATQLSDMLASADVGTNLGELVVNLNAISKDIREQKGTLGKLISSPELHDKALAIAGDLKETSGLVSKLVKEHEERISKILEDVEKAIPEATAAFKGVKDLADKAQNGKGLFSALLSDEEMYKDIKSSFASLNSALKKFDEFGDSLKEGEGLIARLSSDKEMADDFASAVKSIKEVAARLEKTDSTFGKLTSDDEMYKDVKKVLDDARETLRTAREQIPVGTFASILMSAF